MSGVCLGVGMSEVCMFRSVGERTHPCGARFEMVLCRCCVTKSCVSFRFLDVIMQ